MHNFEEPFLYMNVYMFGFFIDKYVHFGSTASFIKYHVKSG